MCIRDRGGVVKVSRSLKELGMRVNAAREQYIKLCGTEPSLTPVSYTHLVKAMPDVRSIKVPMMAWLVLAWASGQTNTQISVISMAVVTF